MIRDASTRFARQVSEMVIVAKDPKASGNIHYGRNSLTRLRARVYTFLDHPRYQKNYLFYFPAILYHVVLYFALCVTGLTLEMRDHNWLREFARQKWGLIDFDARWCAEVIGMVCSVFLVAEYVLRVWSCVSNNVYGGDPKELNAARIRENHRRGRLRYCLEWLNLLELVITIVTAFAYFVWTPHSHLRFAIFARAIHWDKSVHAWRLIQKIGRKGFRIIVPSWAIAYIIMALQSCAVYNCEMYYRLENETLADAKKTIDSLIESSYSVASLEDYDSKRIELRRSLTHFQTTIGTYSTTIASFRRQVDKMKSDTPEQQDSKKKEQKLFEELRTGDDGGIDYDDVSLSESLLPSIISVVDQTLAFAKSDAMTKMEIEARKESIHQAMSIQSQPVHDSTTTQFTPILTQNEHMSTVISTLIERLNAPPLPPITLIPFDGESTHWESLYSQYSSEIGAMSHLSDHAKLVYLRNALTGAALRSVEGIPIEGKNLKSTIARLKSVYGRSKRSNTILINQLFSIRPKSFTLEDQLECTQQLINKIHQLEDQSMVDNFALINQIAGTIHSKHLKKMYQLEPSTMKEALFHIESDLREQLEIAKLESTFRSTTRSGFHQPRERPHNPINDKFIKPSITKPYKGPSCVYCGKHEFSHCTTITSISERKAILRDKKLCSKCLSSMHPSIQCDRKCQQCTKPHHKSICDSPSNNHKQNQSTIAASITSNHSFSGIARLFTAKASLQNPINNTSATKHVFLDAGAMVSVITRSLANELNLKPHSSLPMIISGVGGESTSGDVHDVVTVNIMTTKGLYSINALIMDTVITRSMNLQPLSSEDYEIVQAQCGDVPHLTQSTIVSPDLLIGITDTQRILADSKTTTLPSGYMLTQSILGPIITGQPNSNRSISHHSTLDQSILTSLITDVPFDKRVEQYLSVDEAGREYSITEAEARLESNHKVENHFHETVEKINGHYQVQYFIKPESVNLPTNYELACSRLRSTIHSLSKNVTHLEFYNSIINDQLTAGMIEEAYHPSDQQCHYLAHQAILRLDKPTTPLRIVYDASAKLKGKSCLNDIPRYNSMSSSNEIHLVAFADASKLAMGAVIYLWTSEKSTILMCRSRLAPAKSKATIPKLELNALVMAHTLLKYAVDSIRKEFPSSIIHTHSYSDSAITLFWCLNDPNKKNNGPFVANRVNSIREISSSLSSIPNVHYHQPKYVRTDANPADHITRGLSANEMNDPTHMWWNGAPWMKDPPEKWPNDPIPPTADPPYARVIELVPSSLIDLNRCSSLSKAINITGFMLRFIQRITSKSTNATLKGKFNQFAMSSTTSLSSLERKRAFHSLIHNHQSSTIQTHEPWIKNGLISKDESDIWRANSRLDHSSISLDARSPILIPTSRDSKFARLLITDAHERMFHADSDIKDLGQSLWYTYVTAMTIGYGDFTPKTALCRTMSIVLGYCSNGLVFSIQTAVSLFLVKHASLLKLNVFYNIIYQSIAEEAHARNDKKVQNLAAKVIQSWARFHLCRRKFPSSDKFIEICCQKLYAAKQKIEKQRQVAGMMLPAKRLIKRAKRSSLTRQRSGVLDAFASPPPAHALARKRGSLPNQLHSLFSMTMATAAVFGNRVDSPDSAIAEDHDYSVTNQNTVDERFLRMHNKQAHRDSGISSISRCKTNREEFGPLVMMIQFLLFGHFKRRFRNTEFRKPPEQKVADEQRTMFGIVKSVENQFELLVTRHEGNRREQEHLERAATRISGLASKMTERMEEVDKLRKQECPIDPQSELRKRKATNVETEKKTSRDFHCKRKNTIV
uniref:Ion channel n=1 Tax=Pristionchus pacificus TaxID=54126 RepID=A0A2A6BG39_PRIPA|eukprot:PDM64885.1 ion channel [Pristionchus pacificus]